MTTIRTIVDIHEEQSFAASLIDQQLGFDVDHEPLPEGDFAIITEDGHRTVIERKTWADAMGSWKSKRMPEQISRLVENADRYLLIEDPRILVWSSSKSMSPVWAHLNDSPSGSARGLHPPMVAPFDGCCDRRRTLVSGTFVDRHGRPDHSQSPFLLLERIPKIGRGSREDHVATSRSRINNWDDLDRAPMNVKSKTWGLGSFITEPWRTVSSDDERRS